MTNICGRLLRLLKQKVNALLQRAEDPVESLDLLDTEYVRDLGKMRRHVATVLSEEKRLQSELLRLCERESNSERLAGEMRRSGDETAALRLAARAGRACEHRSEIERAYASLCEQRQELEAIAEEMRLRLESLRVRRQAARAETVASRALIAAREWILPIGSAGIAREESLERAHEALAQLRSRSQALSQLQS